MLVMSISIIFIMLIPLMLRERQGEKLLPWSSGATSSEAALLKMDSWGKLFISFKQVVLLRNTLLMCLIVFMSKGALTYLETLLPVFSIQELGWNNVIYSNTFSISKLVGGVIGMVMGGILIDRLGTVRMFQICLLLAGLVTASMGFFKLHWQNTVYVSAFIAVFNLMWTLITISQLATAMQVCWKRISALQFTFFMTLANAGMAAGSALFGFFRSHFGWQIVFLVFTMMVIAVAVLLKFLKMNTHLKQVGILEQNYLQKEATLVNQANY
jgi:PAT family beta-lactamase induction signal transducer AmpG